MARPLSQSTLALEFLASLKVPEGKLAGKKLRLASYQKEFVRGAFAKGVNTGVLSIGRGNAKTALAAGLALGHLVGAFDPQTRREIILAARNRDQSRIAMNFVLGFIGGMPEDEQALVDFHPELTRVFHREVTHL